MWAIQPHSPSTLLDALSARITKRLAEWYLWGVFPGRMMLSMSRVPQLCLRERWLLSADFWALSGKHAHCILQNRVNVQEFFLSERYWQFEEATRWLSYCSQTHRFLITSQTAFKISKEPDILVCVLTYLPRRYRDYVTALHFARFQRLKSRAF